MSSLSEESIEQVEQKCMEDYREYEGKILLATLIKGMVDDNSVDFRLKNPVRVRVVEHQRENSMLNWTTPGWCDAYWEVELLERHEELEMASSLWVDGIGHSIDGEFDRNTEWMLDPSQEHPTAKEHIKTSEEAIKEYQKRARDFFKNELDENEWDIDDEPTVSVVEYGAYVQIWKWFPAEGDEE